MTEGRDTKTKKATLAAVGYAVIFGFSFMASRIALTHSNADTVLALRFTASMLVMLILLAFGVFRLDLRGKPIGRFLIMGLCQPVLYFIAETLGIQYTNSSFSGIIISVIPIVTAVMSAMFLKEKMPLRTLGWILVSIVGVFIISINQTGSGAIQAKGIFYLFLAVVAASAFYTLSRSVADAFTPWERTFIMMAMGFVYFFGKAVISQGKDFLSMFTAGVTDPYVILPILYLSVLSGVIAFMFQNYAVTYLDLAHTTVFENLIPVISVAAGVIFLGEPFSLIQLAGIVLILLGVWKVSTE